MKLKPENAELFYELFFPLLVRNIIITDGLVSVSQIRFGRNYSADFKETYMTAKYNGSIKSKRGMHQ